MEGTQQTQTQVREKRAEEYDAEVGERVEVSYEHINGQVERLVGDVVAVGCDRFTVAIERGPYMDDRLYTVHTPLIDGVKTKLYGHGSNTELSLHAPQPLPAPAGYDSRHHTVNHVRELTYYGWKVQVAPAPEQATGEKDADER